MSKKLRHFIFYFLTIFIVSLTTNNGFTQNRFWVNGSGTWSDSNHWSETSGGKSGASIPSEKNNVIFDNNSFTENNQTVLIDGGVVCKDFNWNVENVKPVLKSKSFLFKSNTKAKIDVYGSLNLNESLKNEFFGDFDLMSNKDEKLNIKTDLNSNVSFNSKEGSWKLFSDINTSGEIKLITGTLNLNNQKVDCNKLNISSSNPRKIYFGDSKIIVDKVDFSNSENLEFDSKKINIEVRNTYSDKNFKLGVVPVSLSKAGAGAKVSLNIEEVIVSDAICNGDTGGIFVSISGGIKDYTYTLYDYIPGTPPTIVFNRDLVTPDTTYYFGGLYAGQYVIRVEENGIELDQKGPFTIKQPTVLVPNDITVTKDLTCYDGFDAELTANPTGGTAPYTFQWYKRNFLTSSWDLLAGQINQTATGLSQGRYKVEINDKNTCGIVIKTIDYFYGLLPIGAGIPAPISINPDPVDYTDACQGSDNGTITIVATGGTTDLDYSITAGGGGPYQEDGYFTGVSAGLKEIWVMDDVGCKKQGTDITIGIIPQPTANAGANGETCAGSDYIFNVGDATATNAASVYWTTSGDGLFTGGATLTPTYSPGAGDITAGSVVLTLHAVGNGSCAEATSPMTLSITAAPIANAGANGETCAGSDYIFNVGDATATNAASVYWTTSGDGLFTGGATLTPTYSPGAGDITAGSVVLTLHAVGNGSCAEATSPMTLSITAAPIANAGANGETCAGSDYIFNVGDATATNAASVYWTTSGDGLFTGGATLTPTYSPGAGDIAAGSVVLTLHAVSGGSCPESTSPMTLSITAAPTANAGANGETCAGSDYIFNVGDATATNAASVYWTTSGDGLFTGGATLTPTYSPGAGDITAGSVVLTLHAVGNGSCAESTSPMTLSITAAPIANAGANGETCAGSDYIFNVGDATATNAASVYWTTSGDGLFTGGATLTPTYSPGAGDITAGSVVLTLHAVGNGSCAESTSPMTLSITAAPTANAGANGETCAGSDYIFNVGDATATNAASVYWTTSGDGLFTGGATLTPTYSPGAGDITAGSVVLTLHAVSGGSCPESTSPMTLSITAAPTANAGANGETCAGSDYIFNVGDATATNAASVYWTTSGDGLFTGGATLTPTYSPGAGDITAGSVVLTLHAVGNGSCAEATSPMTLSITPQPTANAGANGETCAGSDYIFNVGDATATNAASVYWTTSGDGLFTGGATLTPTYSPGAGDITAGSVVLTLHAVGNGSCAEATSPMTLSITAAPTANAGANGETCAGSDYIFNVGDATATNAASVYWTTSGDGLFTGGATLTPTYSPGAGDITAGSVVLTLHAVGNGSCAEATSPMTLSITAAPIANAGANGETCAGSDYIFNVGDATATNAASVYWTTSGDGLFTGGATLTPTYSPGAGDITAGSVVLTLHAVSGGSCPDSTSPMTLSITAAPTANAGANGETCAGSDYIFNVGDATATNAASVYWTTSGDGLFTGGATLTPTYSPGAGDITAGSVVLTLHAVGNGSCAESTSPMTLSITAAPIANAGANGETCAGSDYIFNVGDATATNAASVYWTTSGDGLFTGGATLTPTYSPGAGDITAGSVVLTLHAVGNGSCAEATSPMTLSITPQPTANAGANGETCAGSDYIFNVGDATATNAASVYWTTSGDGLFTGGATLTPTYSPGAGDITAGSVVLTLHAVSGGSCPDSTSPMTLSITAAPTANAGANGETCAGSDYIFNVGDATATNAASVYWTTSGDGLFTGGATLTPTYSPGAGDITAGSVVLTLHAVGNGSCAEATSPMTLSITPQPTANAGANGETCAGSDYIFNVGDATATNAASVYWTTSGDGLFTGGATLTPTYSPGAGDIAAGSVVLTLHAVGNGSCAESTSPMTLSITAAPTANAGANGETCAGSDYIFNVGDATATNAASVYWTTSGDGLFTGGATLIPTYSPGAGDITAGSVVLTLHAVGNGSCAEATDVMLLTIHDSPTAYAGKDTTICYGASYKIEDADTSLSSSVKWTSSGDGTFDDDTQIDPTYTPGVGDLAAGTVTLTLEAFGNAPCTSVTDDMDINIAPEFLASIGKPKPFDIEATTKIYVAIRVTGRYALHDLGYYLVAPDGTKITLQSETSASVCNFGDIADIEFSTEEPLANTLDICAGAGPPPPISSNDLYGTYAAVGDWSDLYGMDPANGAWRVMVEDCDNSAPGLTDGIIESASITFIDNSIFTGLPETVLYESGIVNIPIDQSPVGGCIETAYAVPMGLAVSCFGECDASAVATGSGGTTPYIYYEWSTSLDFSTPFSTDQTVNLCAGKYYVQITDYNKCTAIDSVIVSSPPEIIITNRSFVQNKCNGDSIGEVTLEFTGGAGGLTYTHDKNTGPAKLSGETFDVLKAGPYVFTISDGNCSIDTNIIITEPTAMTITVDTTNISCYGIPGGEIDITVSGGTSLPFYEYSIDSALSWHANPFINLDQDTFYVAVKDGLGCIQFADTIKMLYPDTITIDAITVVPTTCAGGGVDGQIIISASGGANTLQYSLDGITYQTSNIFTGLSICDTTVFVKDRCDVKMLDTLVSVTGPVPPVINSIVVSDVSCFGGNTGQLTVNASGGTGILQYYRDGVVNSPPEDNIFTDLTAGTYIISVIDGGGCSSADSTRIIKEPTKLVITDFTIINASECNPTLTGSITVHVVGGVKDYWFNIDGGADQRDSTFTGVSVGIHTFTVRDNYNCIITEDTTISLIDPLKVSFNVTDVLCNGLSNGQITATASDGTPGPGYSYLWETGEITQTINGLETGYYTVTITDSNTPVNCILIDSAEVKEPAILSVIPNVRNKRCINSSSRNLVNSLGRIIIDVNGGTPDYTYKWTGPSIDPSNNDNDTIKNLQPGSYYVTITDYNECSTTYSTTLVEDNSFDILDFDVQMDDNSVCWNDSVRFTSTYAITGIVDSIFMQVMDLETNTASNWTYQVFNKNPFRGRYKIEGDSDFERIRATNKFCKADTTHIIIDYFHDFELDIVDDFDGNSSDDTLYLKGSNSGNLAAIVLPIADISFSWSPPETLSSPNSQATVVTPNESGWYQVIATSADECIDTSSIYLEFIPVIVPNDGFSPNGDGINDYWKINYIDKFPNNIVTVYSRWGVKVFEQKGYDYHDTNKSWDGKAKNGKDLPSGTYYYVIILNEAGFQPITGPITIIR